MNDVRFSIIIPVYNAERTLKRCIESILTENESDMEIILINDGSTDSSLSICQSYAAMHSNVYVFDKPNGGAASARNVGIDRASGEYILFIDSDDTIAQGYFISLKKMDDSDFIVFGMESSDEDTKTISLPFSGANSAVLYLVKTRDGSPCNKRFKRNIISISNARFPEDLAVGEDFIFCLRYAMYCKTLQCIPKILYHYDISQTGSLTRKYRTDYVEQAILIYRYAFEIINNNVLTQADEDELKTILDYNYCRTAFACATIPVKYAVKSRENVQKEIKYITEAFSFHMKNCIQPRNMAHVFMRFFIKKRVWLALYVIAGLYSRYGRH